MAGARQQDVSGAMMSILKKMDAMLDDTNKLYEEQLVILSSIETIQKTAVVKELQSQTKILQSIESKLDAHSSGGGLGGGNLKEFKEAFGDVATVIEKLIKATEKIDDKKSENIANFFTKLAESINKFVKEVDADKAKAISDTIKGIAMGAILYAVMMTIATPLLILALPGAFLFGLSLKLLFMGMKNVDPSAAESIKAVLGLAKGVILYSLAMFAVTILMPVVLIGSLLFGLSIRLLLLAAGTAKEGQVEAIEAVLGLAKGIVLYTLAMVVVTLLIPAVLIGSLLFGLSIRLLLLAAGTAKQGQVEAISAILGLAKGILLYTLAMVVVTLMIPIVLIGSLLFGLSIRLLLLAAGAANRDGVRAMEAVLSLSKGILLYVLAMLIVTLAMPIVLIGTLILVGTFFLLSIGLKMLGKKDSIEGVLVLLALSVTIMVLGLAIMLFGMMASAEDILKVTLTIAIMGLLGYIIGKQALTVFEGALALIALGLALVVFSIGFWIFSKAVQQLNWEHLAMMGAVIGIMSLVGYVLGQPEIAMFAAIGAGVLILLGAAFIAFSVGFLIFATAVKILDPGDEKMMEGSLLAVGMAMAKLGPLSPLIALGAAAMIVAGAALIPISIGMVAFKAIGFTKEHADTLEYSLGALVNGFLGGPIPGGLVEGLKFAAKAAARSALLAVASVGFLAAGVALIPIAASLSIFKKSGFTKDDADSLEYMLSSVVKAFGIVTDYKRQKELGFYVNPVDLFLGIESLSGAGRVLAGLAEGVQAWANLEVNEWEVIKGGTKDAKLVIKGRRKLNKSDFENAAIGMSTVISAIAEPFAKVGRLERGQSTGDRILDEVFGNNYVSTGIDALSRSGDTLISLADGVRAFATMQITEYEVVNAGTKDAKLVPKSRKKLSDTDLQTAGNNIAKIITTVAYAFAQVGRWESKSEGVFADGYVGKGVSALAGVGDILKSVTESVIKMAYNEIPQFDLINAGTDKAKLVPGTPIKLKDTDLKKAAHNIGEILRVIAYQVAEIGRMEANSEGVFADGYVGKGVEALGNIGDTVSKITESVIKFASGSVPTFDLINAGTSKAKLVPGKTITLSPTILKNAARTIGSILSIIGHGVGDFGRWAEKNKTAIDAGVDAITSITEAISETPKVFSEWVAVKDPKVGIDNITNFLSVLKEAFDPSKNKDIDKSSWYFTQFATNIEKISENVDQFTKLSDNFDKIQKSMKLMKDHLNGMDLKKLTLTDSMMRSIAALSKNPEAIASMVADSINKSFEELINALKELSSSAAPSDSGDSTSGGSTDTKAKTVNTTVKKENPPKDKTVTKKENKPTEGSGVRIINVDELARAIKKL